MSRDPISSSSVPTRKDEELHLRVLWERVFILRTNRMKWPYPSGEVICSRQCRGNLRPPWRGRDRPNRKPIVSSSNWTSDFFPKEGSPEQVDRRPDQSLNGQPCLYFLVSLSHFRNVSCPVGKDSLPDYNLSSVGWSSLLDRIIVYFC